jgi:ubiquinone/menaquinone biosynthesis C-methylase UbiE
MTIAEVLPTATGYALDSAWYAERERLDSITGLYDPGTLDLCQRLGVSNGWRCLDAGAGTGSLAQSLAALVAPEGSVTALDVDTRFLDPLAGEHLHVVNADITTAHLPNGGFDLVHARLLLEHLPERDTVLGALVHATKPGGTVLIEDFDWATALLVDPPSALHEKVAAAIRQVFSSHGYLPTFARTLPRRLVSQAGFDGDLETRVSSLVRGTPRSCHDRGSTPMS